MKQDELTLLLLGHSNHIMLYFSRPLCGFGSNISKIFNTREWSFPDATRKDTGKQWKMLFFSWWSLSISWKATFEGSVPSRSSAQRCIGTPLSCLLLLSEPHPGRASTPETYPRLTSHHPPFLTPTWLIYSSADPFLSHQEVMRVRWENRTDGACVAHYKQPHKCKTCPRTLMPLVFF